MSWKCHGRSNAELITNLQKHGILSSKPAAEAMLKMDRADFVPDRHSSYIDAPQSIGYGATISAPHMHAYCLSMLEDHLKPGMSILDVGSGSGYLTAVIALMVGESGRTIGIEYVPELVEKSIEAIRNGPAGQLLESGTLSIHVVDGKQGYPGGAPYDAIHVGAAAAEIPQSLLEQLKPGGRMVIPVGKSMQLVLKGRGGNDTSPRRAKGHGPAGSSLT
ncbi:hypothetical protein O6H91_15G082600 [Diphasiastrum complanatum]|uniref:Uncharacterized protein n=1 Tax=Diphasiastrum complanatum TaxID=34168 RepID=A0ACC2BKD4_DIPCM|nr:hypothetical protein O6H91_15G082600 [Diphasiastrum complanatum]